MEPLDDRLRACDGKGQIEGGVGIHVWILVEHPQVIGIGESAHDGWESHIWNHGHAGVSGGLREIVSALHDLAEDSIHLGLDGIDAALGEVADFAHDTKLSEALLVFLKPFLRHVALHLDAVCGLHGVRLGLRLVDEVLEKGDVLPGLPVLRGHGGVVVDIASSASDPLTHLFPESLTHPCATGLGGVGKSGVDAIPLFRGELGKVLGEVFDIGAVGLREVGCVLRARELHQRVHGAFALWSHIVHELLGAGVELHGGIQHGGLPPFRHGGELVGVALLPIGKGEP